MIKIVFVRKDLVLMNLPFPIERHSFATTFQAGIGKDSAMHNMKQMNWCVPPSCIRSVTSVAEQHLKCYVGGCSQQEACGSLTGSMKYKGPNSCSSISACSLSSFSVAFLKIKGDLKVITVSSLKKRLHRASQAVLPFREEVLYPLLQGKC